MTYHNATGLPRRGRARLGIRRAAPPSPRKSSRSAYSGPLSGGAALYGKNVLDGMEMAANEINAAGLEVGGKKYKLEIVALDDKYNPSETAINAQRLVQQHKTPAVLVPHSGGIFALQAFNETAEVPAAGVHQPPQVTERGNKLTHPHPADFTSYIEPFIKLRDGQVRQERGASPTPTTTMRRPGPRPSSRPGKRPAARSWRTTRCPTTRRPTSTAA